MSDLIFEISKLSLVQRLQLVQAILDGIAAESEGGSELTKEQVESVMQRSKDLRGGRTTPVKWDSIREKLQTRYGDLIS